jgi:hypothetical protein
MQKCLTHLTHKKMSSNQTNFCRKSRVLALKFMGPIFTGLDGNDTVLLTKSQ